ncbi:hypothetical protein AB0E08_08050 [Streptomyces sp. NPDC048281]|uniref:hypothetical protein n=1 Tax=Streptomyces sp. NPDC048281 TaxID=3154715 RepID=UPI00344331EA
MTTTSISTHSFECPQPLIRGDEEKNLVLTFTRTMARIQALQALTRLYPCLTATDDVQIDTALRREVDIFGRITIIGIASAPCGTPETCSETRRVNS